MARFCVIAIDIGETHSCILFSLNKYKHEFRSIYTWKGSTTASYKVPTVALFNEKKELHSFGFEAQNLYADLKDDEDRRRWFYFQGFGRKIFDCTLGSTLSDASGKKMDKYLVFSSAIKFFKDTVIDYFQKRSTDVVESDLHFAMIVPSVFKRSLQRILQEAFISAGIEDGKYSFVRESEAVFSYWKYIMTREPTHLDLTDGKCFLIVNLKGRTASITAQTASGGVIRRLHSISGGGWGGQAVNEEFKQLLIKLIGAPVFLQFVDKHSDDWVEFEREFESIKRSLHPEYDGKITLKLFPCFVKVYKESFNESIEDAVDASPFAGEITFISDKMRISTRVFKGLFMNAIEKIISNINNTLTSDAIKDVKTEVIFLVGGFSESLLVQDAVRKAFPNYKVICPKESTLTVGKGAVLHGHHTEQVKRRHSVISKFTYGVHFCQVNNEGGRSEVEKSETYILVRKGDKVYEGEKITWKCHADLCDEEHIEVQFFVSPRTETLTMGEGEVVCMEMVRIDVDGTYTKDVEIRIVFQGDRFFGSVSGKTVLFNEFK